MASYTIELRNVCEIYGRDEVENWFKDYDLTEYLLPDQIEQLNKYNIFNKNRLAQDIVDHYFMREIGFETPALFKHYAKVKMKDIMQEKLPLFYTMSLNYDPLVNVDYTETFKRTAKGTSETEGSSESNSNNNAEGMNINNNTPQKRIEKQDLESGLYASSTNQSNTNSQIQDFTENSSSGNSTTEEEYLRNFKGNQGISATYQAMIKQFRENIISIDKDIIDELDSLFIGLF